MTPSQLDDSLKAPWTRTIVGFSLLWAWLDAAAITALVGKAPVNSVFFKPFMFPPVEIEFGDTIWPRAPRMPNVVRGSFKGFRQPNVLSGQEILLGQEKIAADRQVLSSSQVRTLNWCLLIPKRLIFESSVRDGSPNLAAAPAGPEMRPLDSASAASIISLSCLSNAPPRSGVERGVSDGFPLSHVSSTAKVSESLRMTARSMTFCSSRTLPGHS